MGGGGITKKSLNKDELEKKLLENGYIIDHDPVYSPTIRKMFNDAYPKISTESTESETTPIEEKQIDAPFQQPGIPFQGSFRRTFLQQCTADPYVRSGEPIIIDKIVDEIENNTGDGIYKPKYNTRTYDNFGWDSSETLKKWGAIKNKDSVENSTISDYGWSDKPGIPVKKMYEPYDNKYGDYLKKKEKELKDALEENNRKLADQSRYLINKLKMELDDARIKNEKLTKELEKLRKKLDFAENNPEEYKRIKELDPYDEEDWEK